MECPKAERQKYAGIGATVMITGLLAMFSGGYALHTAFDSLWLSIPLGIFWGLLIFNLDRFLVSTMKKSRGKLREVVQITPRFFLAILLSLVISVPLELKIFEEEIEESLYYAGAEKVDRLDSLYDLRLATQEARIAGLKSNTEKKADIRDDYYQQYVCECDGTCGTGQKGRGTECERKEKKYLLSEVEYQEAKTANEAEIAIIIEDKKSLLSQHLEEKAALESSFSDGLLVRLDALNRLPYGPQLAIILLLIAIELAPILVKLLSPYGPYDHLLKTIEYQFEIDEITAINLRNQQLNDKLTVMASIEKSKLDQEIKNNEGAMKLIGEAHLQLVQEHLKQWVESEKEKLKSEQANS
jgi:hypothetical protein